MKQTKKPTEFDIIEIIEQEMISMWNTGEIPILLKKDPEFVQVIMEGLMLERSFWSQNMVVGEA
jgi:hypothetical protein|tara:strand:+ start:1475 stop:1666 length:192 start_codon:yes stop_codon:yes gene_type:complete